MNKSTTHKSTGNVSADGRKVEPIRAFQTSEKEEIGSDNCSVSAMLSWGKFSPNTT